MAIGQSCLKCSLGLGDLVLKCSERRHPLVGRHSRNDGRLLCDANRRRRSGRGRGCNAGLRRIGLAVVATEDLHGAGAGWCGRFVHPHAVPQRCERQAYARRCKLGQSLPETGDAVAALAVHRDEGGGASTQAPLQQTGEDGARADFDKGTSAGGIQRFDLIAESDRRRELCCQGRAHRVRFGRVGHRGRSTNDRQARSFNLLPGEVRCQRRAGGAHDRRVERGRDG